MVHSLFLSYTSAVCQWQQFSNLRTKTVNIKSLNTPIEDSLLIPNSLIVHEVSADCYRYDYSTNVVIWNDSCTLPGEVKISYRVLPSMFSSVHSLSGYKMDSNFVFQIYNQDEINDRNPLAHTKGLNYSGAYSRSVNVGNTQNLNLNSNFNMQMSGYIIDSIKVEGAITDNNIPFQPEGNTQRLQEFDRVYISLEKNKHKLTLGDFNLDNTKSYFLRFHKRVQGISYEGKNFTYGSVVHNTLNTISVSKGQFANNTFQGIEGNQGPYKLQANNGEQFFIILAGTERVYIDGILLTRGENNDYIINYNLGEIIFMPRIMITKDKRIQVQFEYQDRNYLNSLIYTQNDFKIGDKWKASINIYSNQDAKNQPFLQELNDEQKRILKSVGDNINEAYYQNSYIDTLSSNKILYRLMDTTISGVNYDRIYEYSIDKSQTLYQVSFSFVGDYKGHYIISKQNTNGRSYQWIPPIDGVPQGNYAPVSLIVTPKQHQVITASASYCIDSLKILSVESSLSNYNPNLFSDIPIANHIGMAHRIKYEESRILNRNDTLSKDKIKWNNEGYYEMVQSRYKSIAPYRNIEFLRDWNIVSQDSTKADEHIGYYNTLLSKNNLGSVGYRFTLYNRSNNYLGTKHELFPTFLRNKYKIGMMLSIMNSKSDIYRTRFWRPSFFAEKQFPSFYNTIFGLKYNLEDNTIHDHKNEKLLPISYSFDIYNAYLKGSNDNYDYNIIYTLRQDRKVKQDAFAKQNAGHSIDININIKQWENHQLDITGGYRMLNVYDSTLSTEEPGSSLVGRINYNGNIKNGLIQTGLLYEMGSGQEQKRAFTFVEVPIGQGFYYWIDYNNDGIQQANEFEIGIYPDQKKYIKIITPTNEYNKVNYNQFTLSFDFNPSAIKNLLSKRLSWLSRWQNTLSIIGNSRYLQEDGINGYIPMISARNEANIVNHSLNILNTLYFNRSNNKFGMTYTYLMNQGSYLLTYGLEKNQLMRHSILARYNISKQWSTNVIFKKGNRSYNSGINDNRSYDYKHLAINPTLSFMNTSRLRITTQYEYDYRKNQERYGGELAKAHSAKLDIRLSFVKIGSILLNGTMTHLQYDGDEKSPRAFAILESLKRGQNYIWNLQWDTKISKNIELSIQYDGRKSAGINTVHTGRMSVRALL